MRRSAFGGLLGAAVGILALALVAPVPARADEPSAAPAASDSAKTVSDSGSEAAKGTAKKAGTKKTTKSAKRTAAKGKEAVMPGTMPVKPESTPKHIQVQHILIGFEGSVPGKDIHRTKEEAKKLAYEILERARKGEDFLGLVSRYTDDSPPGIYGMSGAGVAPGADEHPRDRMVPAFGNVGFNLSPGNIGIADYDPKTSPYGWHIIKRLK